MSRGPSHAHRGSDVGGQMVPGLREPTQAEWIAHNLRLERLTRERTPRPKPTIRKFSWEEETT